MNADQDPEKKGSVSYDHYGASRNRRSLPALHPSFFKIDERTLADFLVFAEKYAAYIYIDKYEENSHAKETWKKFLASDISVFLAKLCCGKPERRITYSLKAEATLPHLHVMRKLDAFLDIVSNIADTVPYLSQVHLQHKKIAHLFHQLDELDVWTHDIVSMCRHLGVLIDYKGRGSGSTLINEGIPLPPQEEIIRLDTSLDTFLAVAHKVSYSARELFETSVQSYQYHNPAIALFIAFLKLHGFLQADLNQITGRHLDYFFKTLLQQKIEASAPDQVHVCFILSDHAETYTVEKGALFRAGVDEEGLDCLYEAKDYLSLNKTKVASLGSFYISKREEIGIEPHYEFISGIYESKLLEANGAGFDLSAVPKPFPTFGEEQYDTALKSMAPSEIGFAFASPVLLLREGIRKVNLAIQFNLKSMSALVSFFERYSKKETLSADKVFHTVFSNAFKISLTTENGWYTVADYKVLPPDWSNGKIEISFTLPMGAPGIAAMGAAWDEQEIKRYDTLWPVMKVCISDQQTMYTYSYLQHLVIHECTLEVDVRSIKNIEVYNDLGKVETSIPFYPFGPLPVVGSTFVMGYDELFKKHIKNFSLDMVWHNLPRDEGGFKEYYREYNKSIDNSSFKVGITALSNYEFYPKAVEKIQVFSLFTTVNPEDDQSSSQRLASKTSITGIDVEALKISSEFESTGLQPFDNTTKNGYLKLELLAPEMSFGHQEYLTVLSAGVIRKVKNEDARLPNPPYIPQLKSLVLNYNGFTRICFQRLSSIKADPRAEEKVYQLQPFGVRTIFEKCAPLIDNLFPQYEHNGYLLLGLDYIIPNEPVAFCFVLEQNIIAEFESDIPVIDWFFVSGDNWVPFERKYIIFDTTKSFTTSGIIKLVMPSTLRKGNTILPGDKYWIIAALKGDTQSAGKIRGVYTQALTLCWRPHKAGAIWENNIPAYTIESMIHARSEIATVFQPMASYGGRHEEGLHDFYTRVSERLRHKNRGVTAWDIERLVLERFPDVNQVKCISAIDAPQFVTAGKIVLVVVPRLFDTESFSLPRFNPSVLKEIQAYVEKCVSLFVDVAVINPVYEAVKVTASVTLVDQVSLGGNEEALHRDIRSFICPWYNNPGEDMMFGGWIDLDEVTDFLNARPYIKSVSKVSLVILHYNAGAYTISDSVVSTDVNKTLYASRPWSVLIPMKNHQITIQEEDPHLAPEKAAIENMRLGNEFVIISQNTPESDDADLPEDISFDDYVFFDVDL